MTTGSSSLATITPHAVLRAQDLARARDFYRETLGLPVRELPGAPGELRVDAGAGMICIYERPAMPAPANTVLCFEVADIDAAVAELRARGLVFEEYDMPEAGLVTIGGIAEVHGQRRAWFKDSEENTLVVAERK